MPLVDLALKAYEAGILILTLLLLTAGHRCVKHLSTMMEMSWLNGKQPWCCSAASDCHKSEENRVANVVKQQAASDSS